MHWPTTAQLPPMTTDRNSSSVREARRQLAAKIRDNWEFTWNPESTGNGYIPPGGRNASGVQPSSAPASATEDATFTNPHQTSLPSDLDTVLGWRERNYASSDPSTQSSDNEQQESSVGTATKPTAYYRDTSTDPMEVDTVDRNPPSAEQEKRDRKRRRRRRLEEEMSWNPGLAHWTARRDAWCCAKLVRRGSGDEQADASPASHEEDSTLAKDEVPEYLQGPLSDDKQPSRVASNEDEQYPAGQDSREQSKDLDKTTSDPSSITSLTTGTTTTTDVSVTSPSRPPPVRAYTSLVPLAPPILSQDDPTYTHITPALYPSIYSKVVTRSLTPSIPINLSHMVGALVQGWKEDGEWPPKTTYEGTLHSQTVGVGRGLRGGSKDGAAGGVGSGLRGGSGRARRLLERHRRIDSNGGARRAVAAAVADAEGGAEERRREGEAMARIKGENKTGSNGLSGLLGLDGSDDRSGSVNPDHNKSSNLATGDDNNGRFRKSVAKVGRALRLSISETGTADD